MSAGRPLRFLGGVVAGWTALRVVMLWPADVGAPAPTAASVRAEPVIDDAPVVARETMAETAAPHAETAPAPIRRSDPRMAVIAFTPASANEAVGTPASANSDSVSPAQRSDPAIVSPPLLPLPATRSRLTVDAWIVARPSGGDTLAFAQLGASQAGVRATYALDGARRVALSARASAPFRGRGAEFGLGVDLRPTALPVHLLVEERFGPDDGARPAVTLIAGGSAALPGRIRLDAYGQGGAVWKRGGFVDAAALITRSVTTVGRARLEAGAGAWGAGQRRLGRLDLGPSAALITPIGGAAARLQLDYRLRVAGSARPGSGPALTLGSSF